MLVNYLVTEKKSARFMKGLLRLSCNNLKGTAEIISNEPPFIEGDVRFMVPFKALFNHPRFSL